MRKVLAFVLMTVCATAVQAQERVAPAPDAPVAIDAVTVEAPPAETATTPKRGNDVPVIDMNPRNTTAAAVDAATMRAPVDVDETAQDVTAPRNFWWLVGAIVLAGIVLAVLL